MTRSDAPGGAGERLVTVCASCLCAICWHGDLYCCEAKTAGTVQMTVTQLRRLKLEHRSHYSVKRIREVCGDA